MLSHRSLAVTVAVALPVLADATVSRAELVYAVTMQNFLTSFDSATPFNLNSGVQITGVQPGELIMGIDFRPASGVLFGMGSQNRLYTINLTTGVATAVGAQFSPPASGVEFGFDFNPVVDRIRVVSDVQQNFRLNPDTGLVAGSDTNLAYAAGDANAGQDPSVMAAAYTPISGQNTTTLFVLDSRFNTLVRQGGVDGTPSPNGGQLTTIGALGIDFVEMGGFDISGSTGVAYAALLNAGTSSSTFFTINLGTGSAGVVGTIGGGLFIRDIAVIPSPGTMALMGAGMLLAARRRR